MSDNKKPAQQMLTRAFGDALAVFVERPQAEVQIGAG
jgi:hypothetical protein